MPTRATGRPNGHPGPEPHPLSKRVLAPLVRRWAGCMVSPAFSSLPPEDGCVAGDDDLEEPADADEDLEAPEDIDEAELEDLEDDDLTDDELVEGDPLDRIEVADGEDLPEEEEAQEEESVEVPVATVPDEDEDDEEDDEPEPDEVEATLDEILKERLVVGDDEDEDEEEAPDTEDRGDGVGKVLPKQPGEFVCQSCFLVKHPSQLADPGRMWCRDCV